MTVLRKIALLAVAAALLAGCGDSDDSTATSATSAPQDAAFPATVEHKFATTTVKSAPKRIAIVGLTEQDTVLALGYKPIATTEWYGKHPYAVWPWARKALGSAKPTVLSAADGLQYERIAKLRPDLIIGTNAGLKRGDYTKLSKIAPTIAGAKGSTDYFGRWDEQTLLIAKALGKPDAGRELVADVKARFAAVAARHPEFKGKVATFSQNGFYSGKLYVYPPGLNTEFLSYLGFTINPKLAPLAPKPGVQAEISAERLDVIDADVIVFATEDPKDIRNLEKVPTFRGLDAVAENRAVYTDPVLSGAMYFISPLSLPYVLDRLAPQLAKAVAGKQPRRIIDTA